MLLNLVGNAIKFTDHGEVRVEVSHRDDAFRVSVVDTGLGIAVGDQERIFEEFQQADGSTTRKKGGTGLGLAIVKRIIALHGGTVGSSRFLEKVRHSGLRCSLASNDRWSRHEQADSINRRSRG